MGVFKQFSTGLLQGAAVAVPSFLEQRQVTRRKREDRATADATRKEERDAANRFSREQTANAQQFQTTRDDKAAVIRESERTEAQYREDFREIETKEGLEDFSQKVNNIEGEAMRTRLQSMIPAAQKRLPSLEELNTGRSNVRRAGELDIQNSEMGIEARVRKQMEQAQSIAELDQIAIGFDTLPESLQEAGQAAYKQYSKRLTEKKRQENIGYIREDVTGSFRAAMLSVDSEFIRETANNLDTAIAENPELGAIFGQRALTLKSRSKMTPAELSEAQARYETTLRHQIRREADEEARRELGLVDGELVGDRMQEYKAARTNYIETELGELGVSVNPRSRGARPTNIEVTAADEAMAQKYYIALKELPEDMRDMALVSGVSEGRLTKAGVKRAKDLFDGLGNSVASASSAVDNPSIAETTPTPKAPGIQGANDTFLGAGQKGSARNPGPKQDPPLVRAGKHIAGIVTDSAPSARENAQAGKGTLRSGSLAASGGVTPRTVSAPADTTATALAETTFADTAKVLPRRTSAAGTLAQGASSIVSPAPIASTEGPGTVGNRDKSSVSKTPPPRKRGQTIPSWLSNPGDIKFTKGNPANKFAKRNPDGSVMVDKEGHIFFENDEAGWKALDMEVENKLTGKTKWGLSSDSTLAELGKIWAADPDWAKKVAKIMGGGVRPADKASSLNRRKLVEAIGRQEGFQGRRGKLNSNGLASATGI